MGRQVLNEYPSPSLIWGEALHVAQNSDKWRRIAAILRPTGDEVVSSAAVFGISHPKNGAKETRDEEDLIESEYPSVHSNFQGGASMTILLASQIYKHCTIVPQTVPQIRQLNNM